VTLTEIRPDGLEVCARNCRRIVLTHMSADMLRRRSEAEIECADDGQVIVL
jgi:hypothetical protein